MTKTKRRNKEVKANGLNKTEHRLEPVNRKITESPRSVVRDREKTSPRREPSQLSLAAVPPESRTSDSYRCGKLLLQQLRLVLPQRPLDPYGNHAVAALFEISPRDTVEGMLAVQMVAGHSLGMEFLRRAALPLRSSEEMELDLNLATKLLRTYVAQVEGLDRHRGKVEQKVNVEQVHIHHGAQGIAGPVSHQGSLDASAEDHEKSN